ncbi:hypothetical protein EX30DRAFT_375755 [Ascodesmis nigricans]|uniref:Uncharacterized protein n=1 Tax=Ascodesmis nigricans TaxID=341454 RepID=A0A4S2MH29_9PEZI|nr:hypothetical protein EX30DRAFT_375755 [Ascodesmis nigricans]
MPPGNQKGVGKSPREGGEERVEERVEERAGERVTMNLEKFSTLANTTNTVDSATKTRFTGDPKKIPRFDPKERASASRKRPRSGLPLVEDITTAELTNLIQEAIGAALKETNKELELLRKEVAGLEKRLSEPQQTARPNTAPNRPPTSGALNYAQVLESGLSLTQSNSWTKVQAKRTKTKTMTPAKAVTMAQRKIIVLRNAQASKMKTKEDLVAIRDAANKALVEAGALPHQKIACASTNAKGNFILLTRDDCKASELVNFHEAIKIQILQIDPAIESIQGQQTWLKLAIHGIDQLRFPPTEGGMRALQEEIETYNSDVNLLACPRYYT